LAPLKGVGDQLVFSNKRLIATNVQGITGSKVYYTSLPYSKIQGFSAESSGSLEHDGEIELFMNGVGKVHFKIKSSFDFVRFNTLVSVYVLA